MTLSTDLPPRTNSKGMLITGYVLSLLPVLFIVTTTTIMLIAKPGMMKETMAKYGFPDAAATIIPTIEFSCLVLYLIPQTAVLGAILLAAYLGGAVCTHIHAAEYSGVVMPIVFGVFFWLGLWFRDPRVRELAPIRRI